MKTRNLIAPPFLIALTLLVGACGKDGKDAENPINREPALKSFSSITGAADRRSLVGRRVEVTSELVTRNPVGDYIFWAGTANGTDLPVVLEGEMRGTSAENDVRIRRGQRLRVTGVVRLVDGPAANYPADPMWKLIDKREFDDIVNARVYISATDVKTSSGARAVISFTAAE